MKKSIFVIHRHDATHLHYDLRLEVDGVLKSWAIPKIPQITVGAKNLAIQVPDHLLSYALFEGTIPEGDYGAGTVEIWDRGTYTVLSEKTAAESLAQGKLKIELYGKKLKGTYVLVKTHYKNGKSWLFMRVESKDLHAKP